MLRRVAASPRRRPVFPLPSNNLRRRRGSSAGPRRNSSVRPICGIPPLVKTKYLTYSPAGSESSQQSSVQFPLKTP